MKPVNILLIAVTSLLIVGFPLHAEPVAGATGYFHPEQQKGRWWLVDPQGQRFLVQGVDTVTFQQDFIQGTAISPYGNAVRQK